MQCFAISLMLPITDKGLLRFLILNLLCFENEGCNAINSTACDQSYYIYIYWTILYEYINQSYLPIVPFT